MNRERIKARRNAHENGQWVREAATAYAHKKKLAQEKASQFNERINKLNGIGHSTMNGFHLAPFLSCCIEVWLNPSTNKKL